MRAEGRTASAVLAQGRCAVINPHILHKWPKIKPALYLIQPDIFRHILPLYSLIIKFRNISNILIFQEGRINLTVQSCLLEPVSIDLSINQKTMGMEDLDDLDKSSLQAKPSNYLASLVEEWRTHDNSKTLSDGAEWEESTEEDKKDPEEVPRPSVKGRVEGLLEEAKLSGEARLLELIAHPAVGLLAVCFACLNTSNTLLDLLSAFGLLLAMVAHISLLFH